MKARSGVPRTGASSSSRDRSMCPRRLGRTPQVCVCSSLFGRHALEVAFERELGVDRDASAARPAHHEVGSARAPVGGVCTPRRSRSTRASSRLDGVPQLELAAAPRALGGEARRVPVSSRARPSRRSCVIGPRRVLDASSSASVAPSLFERLLERLHELRTGVPCRELPRRGRRKDSLFRELRRGVRCSAPRARRSSEEAPSTAARGKAARTTSRGAAP